jgi:lipopolysaccharide export system permease protein
MGLLVPTFLPLVVPLSLGVAVLFIYHKFAVDSEIVVMRAAGISPLRLAGPALMLGTIILLLCYILTIWVTPAANRGLVALQYKVRDNYSLFLVKPGNFNDVADGLTFYVRSRDKNGQLRDILIHDIRKPNAPVTIMADSGQFTNADGVPKITAFKGKRQELDPETGHLSQLDFDSYVLDLNLLHNSAADRLPDPREMSIWDLLNPPADPEKRRTPVEHMTAEVHQRLATPLLALSYTLIGLATILAGEFNRRGMLKRILIAAAAIVAVQAGMLSLGSLIAKHLWMAPSLYLLAIFPMPISLLLLGAPDWCNRFFLPAPKQLAAVPS